MLHHACKRSLKKTKNVKRTVKNAKRDKLWYDKECEQKNNEINDISKRKSKSPLVREIKEKFKEKMRQYKLLCKNKRMILE